MNDDRRTCVLASIRRSSDRHASIARGMLMTESQAPAWTHHDAVVNGVRLHYVEAGSGPLVLLLHGFPEFWYCWRHQIPALAAAGYRVVAPDLRGYNES